MNELVWFDLDDVMKEYKQDRGGGIVVDSAETYRGLLMLGSMIEELHKNG